jgi:hypothetical protein
MQKPVFVLLLLSISALSACQPPIDAAAAPPTPSPSPTPTPTPSPAPAMQRITADPFTLDTSFGGAVSLCGGYALGGAARENSGKGAAYLFENRNGVWTQVVRLEDSSGEARDYFGCCVKLTPTRIYVGAYKADRTNLQPTADAGALFVYERDKSGIVFLREILYADKFVDPNDKSKGVTPDSGTNECYGYSVAANSGFLLVSNVTDDNRCGSVFAYYNNSGSWWLDQKLTAAVRVQDSGFGEAVCLAQIGNQTYALVGAPADSSNATLHSGAVYVFKREWKLVGTKYDYVWTQIAKIVPSDLGADECFGSSIAANDKYFFVGNSTAKINNQAAGAVYVFALNEGGGFPQTAKVVPPQSTYRMYFGDSIAAADDSLLIGSPKAQAEGSTATCGSAFLFTQNLQGSWVFVKQYVPEAVYYLAGFGGAVDADATNLLVGCEGLSSAYVFSH